MIATSSGVERAAGSDHRAAVASLRLAAWEAGRRTER